MKLLVPVIMLLVICPMAMAEVVPKLSVKCPQFFISAKPPTILPGVRYKQICQRSSSYYYATLYDTVNKIPVYSAYKFLSLGTCDKATWYIEPQLDNQNLRADMATEGSVPKPPRGNKQALNEDYDGSGFHRGHLVPLAQQNSQQCADATFTLTNAAPQHGSFNSGQWRVTEKKVAKLLKDNCVNKNIAAYVVTGVVPGNNKMNNNVNIPSIFWTAYCCLDNNGKAFSGGYYGQNIDVLPPNVRPPITSLRVNALETFLSSTGGYKTPFQVFGGKCA